MQRVGCDWNRAMGHIANSWMSRRYYLTKSKNLYETLGLTRSSTAAEVKGAYYKLSMQYHPDKNADDLDAADKFRRITEAYEVLGNFRLRKLYDKGMLSSSGDDYNRAHETQPEEDDPTTRFYKARMKKEHTTAASGRTPIYDFDEWTNNHYGSEYARQQKLKNSTDFRRASATTKADDNKTQAVMMCFLAALLILCAATGSNFDVDHVSERKKKADGDQNKK